MVDNSKKDGPPVEQVVWVGSDTERTQQTAEPIPPAAAAPAPQPAPEPAPEPGTIPEENTGTAVKSQSKVLAATVISTFTDRLKSEAQKRGGYLTVGDIEQLAKEFESKREALETVFQQSFEQYVRIRERAAFDHARQFPFDRVIVNTFAALFERDQVTADGVRAVTRHILPGFFMALDKMIGPEAMETYQARSRVIVNRLSKGEESELDWVKLYSDPEAKNICFDALVTFAPYFEDLQKRQEWFLPLVNNNLPAHSEWELTDGGFHNLVGEMFSELRDGLANPEERKNLEEKYGGVTCFELDRVFDKMDNA